MRVAVIHHKISNLTPDDLAQKESAKQIADALKEKGYKADILEVEQDSIKDIGSLDYDIFFNLCDWTGSELDFSKKLIQELEISGKYWTGTGSGIYGLCDKLLMKEAFDKLKIPTPKWKLFDGEDEIDWPNKWPAIVKPVSEHCSVGVSQTSIVKSLGQLKKRVNYIYKKYGKPVIIEEFIPGREFQITVVENGLGDIIVLPLAELKFKKSRNFYPILTYKGKWSKKSHEYNLSKFQVSNNNDLLTRNLINLCKQAFIRLGCRNYVRFDIRVKGSEIYFLEVNLNPAVENDPDYSMTMSAKAYGWDFATLVDYFVKMARNDSNDFGQRERFEYA